MQHKYTRPHLGMRIIKTGICVFFCLLLNYLFSPQVALYSSLAAIATMESSLQSTIRMSAVELVGTGLGGCVGMAILPLASMVNIEWLYVIIMPVGMVMVIYVCVLIKMPQAASLCGFVYIAVLVAPYDPSVDSNPYLPALYRITDTAVGVVIALLVNRFIVPPKPAPPRNVHLPINTFSSVCDKVRDKLTGEEQLLLLDTGLLNPNVRRPRLRPKGGGFPLQSGNDAVSIPVPVEFTNEACINGAYVGLDYDVVPFTLKTHHGYVNLPCSAYPATVVWRVPPAQATKHETYGIVHGHGPGKEGALHRTLRIGKIANQLTSKRSGPPSSRGRYDNDWF